MSDELREIGDDTRRLDLLQRLMSDERLEIDGEVAYLWEGSAADAGGYVCDHKQSWYDLRELADDRHDFYTDPSYTASRGGIWATGRTPLKSSVVPVESSSFGEPK